MTRLTPEWTRSDIGSLVGQTIIITGANSGIGFAAAQECFNRGATVVLACRDKDRAAFAARRISQQARAEAGGEVHIQLVDVSLVSSCNDAVAELKRDVGRIDVLINNAGIMAVPRTLTDEGVESQLATNHLGHMALTLGLLEHMNTGARIVNVSSLAHRAGSFDFDDMTLAHGYSPMGAYRRSKLANILFTHELNRRLEQSGTSAVMALSCHPGLTQTNLATYGDRPWWFTLLRPTIGAVIQRPRTGALPTLRAATDPNARAGDYFGPRWLGELFGAPVPVDSTECSKGPELAARLWQWSIATAGIKDPLAP